MAMEDRHEILRLLKVFDETIIDLVMWLRDFAWQLSPDANELIYDNYNAVAFGWSVTDRLGHTFCSIAVGRSSKNVHFGFYFGSRLSDPENILLGKGNQYRYILVKDRKHFPKAYITKLIREAHVNAMAKVRDKSQIIHGQTIVKSVSGKKRPGKEKNN